LPSWNPLIHYWWPNSVPCDCRTKSPIFLLAVNCGPLSGPRGHPHSLHMAPSSFKASSKEHSWRQVLLMFWLSLPKKSQFVLRAHMIRSGLARIISLNISWALMTSTNHRSMQISVWITWRRCVYTRGKVLGPYQHSAYHIWRDTLWVFVSLGCHNKTLWTG
jgi:hypothetical protein